MKFFIYDILCVHIYRALIHVTAEAYTSWRAKEVPKKITNSNKNNNNNDESICIYMYDISSNTKIKQRKMKINTTHFEINSNKNYERNKMRRVQRKREQKPMY